MKPHARLSRVKKTKWYEYLIRFVFGGVITAVAGHLAKEYGPAVGGLFLAFPAILPASATLIEEHEGQMAAGLDTVGAAFGCVGLAVFGAVVWGLGARLSAWLVLALSLLVWFLVSAALWLLWQGRRRARRDQKRRSKLVC